MRRLDKTESALLRSNHITQKYNEYAAALQHTARLDNTSRVINLRDAAGATFRQFSSCRNVSSR